MTMHDWKWRKVELQSFFQVVKGRYEVATPPLGEVAYQQTFERQLPGKHDLDYEEKVLTSFWLAAGSWNVVALANLRGVTGPAWTNVRMTLSAEPSDLYPQQMGFQAAEGINAAPIYVQLYARSAQAMFVTLSAAGWEFPGILEEVKVFAERVD